MEHSCPEQKGALSFHTSVSHETPGTSHSTFDSTGPMTCNPALAAKTPASLMCEVHGERQANQRGPGKYLSRSHKNFPFSHHIADLLAPLPLSWIYRPKIRGIGRRRMALPSLGKIVALHSQETFLWVLDRESG